MQNQKKRRDVDASSQQDLKRNRQHSHASSTRTEAVSSVPPPSLPSELPPLPRFISPAAVPASSDMLFPMLSRTVTSTTTSAAASATPAAEQEEPPAASPPVQIDLSRLAGKDFVIHERDFAVFEKFRPTESAHMETAVDLIGRLPVRENVDNRGHLFVDQSTSKSVRSNKMIGKGAFGAVFSAVTSDGQECVVKLVRVSPSEHYYTSGCSIDVFGQKMCDLVVRTLNEIIIHTALLETINADASAQQKIAQGKMARVPDLYGFFTTSGLSMDPANTTRVVAYIAIVMEKLDTTLWDHLDNDLLDDTMSTAIAAVSFYQVCNLLDFLGTTLRYNHRDLKINNVMVTTTTPTPTTTLCATPHFHTYIIDFGMSRMDYKGHVFAGTQSLFYDNHYNPTHDLLFLAWSYRRSVGCEAQSNIPCTEYNRVFDRILKHLMDSSGIDFEHSNFEDRPSKIMYQIFAFAGDVATIRRISETYVSRKPVKPHLITPRAVKVALKYLIRYLATLCRNEPETRTSVARTHAQMKIMELFGIGRGIDESDDFDVVGDMSVPTP